VPHPLVRTIAALACAAWAGCIQAEAPAPTVERAGDAVVYRGRIDAEGAARFVQLVREPGVRRVVVGSPGGLVGPALDMAEAMHARGLDLEVPVLCRSSCANYLVPAARRKTFGWPGAVAWHGNMTHVLYLAQTGQAQWSEAQLVQARELARREAAFYRRVGVDGYVAWFAKVAPYEVPDFYFLRADDLARFGVRDVTVHEAPTPAGADEDLQAVQVDWDQLPASRPAVDLGP
jgi:hypothetical protein